jgi:O-antigen ligase
MELGLQKPILGYGYGGFWMGERMEFVRDRTNYLFRIGHNGFLETFVEGGFVGVLLLVNIIISSVLKIQKTLLSNFDYGVLRFCLLFMIVICNLTESSFARPQNFLWFVFLLIAISVSDKEHLRRRVGMNITRA